MNRAFLFTFAAVLFLCCAQPVMSIEITEFEVCTDPANQANPDMYYNYIVWQDDRNGNWDIYGYDLQSETEFEICVADGNQTNPSVGRGFDNSEVAIVWQDDRNGNDDIYAYVLYYLNPILLGVEIEVCTDTNSQLNPQIDEDYIVWQDDRNGNWDIYGYDTYESNEIAICTAAADQINPDVYREIFSWQDDRAGNWDIYGYDFYGNFGDTNEFSVCIADGNQINPASLQETFVWQDDRNGNWDIYIYDFQVMEEIPGQIAVTTDTNSQINPATPGGFLWDPIFWQDNRNGNWDIYAYDPITAGDVPICDADGNQINPVNLYDDYVVWQDDRNGNQDIYAALICDRNNDNCYDQCATALVDGIPYFGSTETMTTTYVGNGNYMTSSCGYNDLVDAWHTYIPVSGGPVTITTQGSSFDTTLAVYNDCPDYSNNFQVTELACNDDYCLENFSSKVTLDVVKGKRYKIRVAGYNELRGDYEIIVTRGAAGDSILSDLDGNGKVDMLDFAIFSSEWLMDNTQQ